MNEGTDRKETVVFILPFRDEAPVGGYKIVYGYADRLALEGRDVHLVYPHIKPEAFAEVRNPLLRLKMRLGFLYRYRVRKQPCLGSWYGFRGPVSREYVKTFLKWFEYWLDGNDDFFYEYDNEDQ